MTRPGKLLAIDDEDDILDVYREILAEEGLEIHTARSYQAALQLLDEGDWSIVLIDQRLRGPSSADDGLELIEEVGIRSPAAKTIVVTGYATDDAIVAAFERGVYDYVQKTREFPTLLRFKVRNALEVLRERWLTHASDPASPELAEVWNRARTETDATVKGRLLEDVLDVVLRRVPGFVVSQRLKSPGEEFDLVVRNESMSPFWVREGQYLLVECKNWSSRVGRPELDAFDMKLRRRQGRAKLGFLVAPSGFSEPLKSMLAGRERSEAIVLVDGSDLARLVATDDVDAMLKELHQRSVVA
jgi:CheY-like chemotaxis protein